MKFRVRIKLILGYAILMSVTFTSQQTFAQSYSFTELISPVAGARLIPWDIDSNDQVIGVAGPFSDGVKAFLWNNGTVDFVDPPAGFDGISFRCFGASGETIGTVGLGSGNVTSLQAQLIRRDPLGGAISTFGPSSQNIIEIEGCSKSGGIAGRHRPASSPDGFAFSPFVFRAGNFNSLPLPSVSAGLEISNVSASDLNDSGTVIGLAAIKNTLIPPNPILYHGVIWENNLPTFLPGLSDPMSPSYPRTIRTDGLIGGSAKEAADGPNYATLWRNKQPQKLPELANGWDSYVSQLTDEDFATGTALVNKTPEGYAEKRAVIWDLRDENTIRELQSLFPESANLVLTEVTSISERGSIIAIGNYKGEAEGNRAFLLNLDDFRDQGCHSENIREDKGIVRLGPGELKDYALASLAKLTRKAAHKDPALGARLQRSAKRATLKLDALIRESETSLQAFPGEVLICPESPICTTIDHSESLQRYSSVIARLQANIRRVFNRSSRLGEDNFNLVRIKMRKFGRNTQKIGKSLRAAANLLPKTTSQCVRAN